MDRAPFYGSEHCPIMKPTLCDSILVRKVGRVAVTRNQTGIRAFCAEEDAVVRVDAAGVCSNTEAGVLTFNPLNQ